MNPLRASDSQREKLAMTMPLHPLRYLVPLRCRQALQWDADVATADASLACTWQLRPELSTIASSPLCLAEAWKSNPKCVQAA